MRQQTHAQQSTVVLGGTGKTGRRVVDRLTAAGVPTRVGSRAGTPPFDWDDQRTWPAVLDGAGAVYVAFSPDLAVPGAAEAVGALAALAVDRGVRRLVLLSGRGEPDAVRSEEAVRDVFAEATVLRCSWFDQNFSESYMVEGLRDGVLALPVDGVAEPFVDAEDIADAALAALTEPGHAGRLYELTGPRLLTFADAVREIGVATGRRLRFEPVTLAEFTSLLAAQGVPDDVVSLMTYLFTEVLDGRNANLTDGVRRALGREPRDFGDYARDAAAGGAWAAPRPGFS